MPTQRGTLARDDNGVPLGWTYANITLTTTTVVKASAGILHNFTFNGVLATGIVAVYDGLTAAGTPIATITLPASPQPVTINYDVAFNTGLTVVTTNSPQNITISYI